MMVHYENGISSVCVDKIAKTRFIRSETASQAACRTHATEM